RRGRRRPGGGHLGGQESQGVDRRRGPLGLHRILQGSQAARLHPVEPGGPPERPHPAVLERRHEPVQAGVHGPARSVEPAAGRPARGQQPEVHPGGRQAQRPGRRRPRRRGGPRLNHRSSRCSGTGASALRTTSRKRPLTWPGSF
ncbi:unnamed protein product, partial [Prorocentrum cordatum]